MSSVFLFLSFSLSSSFLASINDRLNIPPAISTVASIYFVLNSINFIYLNLFLIFSSSFSSFFSFSGVTTFCFFLLSLAVILAAAVSHVPKTLGKSAPMVTIEGIK